MTRIAFIGLGNMGGGMAANQAKAGHEVLAFDLSAAALQKAVAAGCVAAGSAAAAVKNADVVITMLPAGQHVRAVYHDEIAPNAKPGALLLDCSTIDVESARAVASGMTKLGFRFADAPVSGGQAAKICNNMVLGASMIAVCEAFALAEKLGLDPERFFEIASKSSGQCWSLTSYCPWPGPVPAAPSNRNYEG
ncbi:MAG: mmsB, partial [Phenylobacterium sp.]|nr:mmsB [Phenylobacterium sp.]